MTALLGALASLTDTRFRVHSPHAQTVDLCLFTDAGETRHAMQREGADWSIVLDGNHTGARYGYRADGPYEPQRGLWFDAAKLLVDPYAIELDRRFVQHPHLAEYGTDTADIVPKGIVPGELPDAPSRPPQFDRGGLIYELNVRGFTMLHPEVPAGQRGTVAALAHPAVIAHLTKLHVSAVELMPIVAWIDERHLPPLGLVNAWGYNPIAPMALDPGLCPGGVPELRETVAALHAAGIGVILDIVLNHTGESDVLGGTLSLRGLDPQAYAMAPDGTMVNDTGCGNTLDFAYRPVRELVLASLHHFVRHCGVDGFRFDLAPVLARGPGFDPNAPFFADIAADPLLADRVLIAEPWDIGPGGYQLGGFPPNWLEWNDRFRDDVRRFWRGGATPGELATRLAGSSDVFGDDCRSVNFLAAHDGFTLADTVTYAQRHNHANGEGNRDGHAGEISWNHGAEGPTQDPAIAARRAADQRAMLGTLFASVGTIMLAAGDEFGRSQGGNNNAYCQDNRTSWVDWEGRDEDLETYVARLSAMRAENIDVYAQLSAEVEWISLGDTPMSVADWNDTDGAGFTMLDPRTLRVIDRTGRAVRIEST